MLAFDVEDVGVARREFEARAVEFVQAAPAEAGWEYYLGPDGYLYALRRVEPMAQAR
jgi:hypothetical protein